MVASGCHPASVSHHIHAFARIRLQTGTSSLAGMPACLPPTDVAEQGGAEVERRLQEWLHIILMSIGQHSQHLQRAGNV